jgi:hypothetical protein
VRWVKKWWWLLLVILAIAYVIGWKEKRCQTQAYKCRAAYEAQAQSERIGSSRLTVDQQASEQQAITAACEPSGYFCRLFSAANIPSVLLLFVAIGGVWAAIETLKAISRQADIMDRQTKDTGVAANAAYRNAEAVINAQRPWLFIPMGEEFSKIENPKLPTAENRVAFVSFDLRNFGQSPARVIEQKVRMYVGNNPHSIPDISAYDSQEAVTDNYVIPQDSVVHVQAPLHPTGYITPQDKDAISAGARYLWLCGYFKYRNASDDGGGDVYMTRLCYLWIHNTNRPEPFWILRGPDEYNKAT